MRVISGLWMWAAWLPVAALVLWLQVRRQAGLWHTLGVLALTTYAFWVASVAFFPMPVEGPPLPGNGGIGWLMLNLVPLRGLVRVIPHQSWQEIVHQHVGNLLLLVPFTVLGPLLWPRLRAWRWALVLGVGISASIELVQLALCALLNNPYRSVDIDDVIVNTAGALLGYALFVGGRRWRRRRSQRGGPCAGEPVRPSADPTPPERPAA
jgi:glycopeptide antibiotics resistance protein